MCKRTAKARLLNFHIQLLADKSVVLVEKNGHESEIFLPELQNGRISLMNVVCSRQPRLRPKDLSCLQSIPRCRRLVSGKLTTATVGLAPKKLTSGKLVFELKLISNGNVVLVECNGYESEIFLPYISSHCVAMKRVCAGELAQCAFRRSQTAVKKPLPTSDVAASIAASLAAQAVSLSKLLVNPIQLLCQDQKERRDLKTLKVKRALKDQIAKLTPISHKKKPVNYRTHEAGDA